ncbi:MAG: M28 family peptidase [Thermodesulfobacteriota bacterium]|nr:M28 family peptidase [Thermodesulfobacteriota bacterium]
MRIIVYTLALLVLAAFSMWAYKAMIGIRPKVRRPRLDAEAREVIKDLEARLKRHVSVLAHEIGPRSVFLPHNLKAASDYVRAFWEDVEYEVRAQTYRVEDVVCHNLAVEIPGTRRPDEIVLIGAHYDTVSHSPGANDNGSAVAALLELSRLFRSKAPKKTVRFVAFANEEPPFFKTSQMGSLVYAKACREQEENIVAMVCLETIGYYRQKPKTQNYPFPLSFFYPDRGDFIAVVGNLRSGALVRSFTGYFMEGSDFPVECAAVFGFITGIDWSDHWSFWHCGYRAVMITDTALFRYPYYHSHEDTADKLDYYSLARVSHGLYKTLTRMVAAGDNL